MLSFYNGKGFRKDELGESNLEILKDAIWIDLLNPSSKEIRILNDYFGFEIPSRDEMVEIEVSSRLYTMDGNLFMTCAMISDSQTEDPKLDPVTFILTAKKLLTIRYIEPQAFKLFVSQINYNSEYHDPKLLLLDLLDTVIDRVADILEHVSINIDNHSKFVFDYGDTDKAKDYKAILKKIAMSSDSNAKIQDSLVSFNRLLPYLLNSSIANLDKLMKLRILNMRKDILSLSHHTQAVSSKVGFLLDATLGLVNIEQNNIIKIFSVAAVIFLPPTLIASIYGMNFRFIPELAWKYGYFMAIGLMTIAAWAPYKYFKYKKWL